MFDSRFDKPDCPREVLVNNVWHLLEEILRVERENASLRVQRDINYKQWQMIAKEFELQGLKYERLP